jgi:hypothetical protein
MIVKGELLGRNNWRGEMGTERVIGMNKVEVIICIYENNIMKPIKNC